MATARWLFLKQTVDFVAASAVIVTDLKGFIAPRRRIFALFALDGLSVCRFVAFCGNGPFYGRNRHHQRGRGGGDHKHKTLLFHQKVNERSMAVPPLGIALFSLIVGILSRAQDNPQGDGAQAQMIGQTFFQVTQIIRRNFVTARREYHKGGGTGRGLRGVFQTNTATFDHGWWVMRGGISQPLIQQGRGYPLVP